MIPGSEGWQTPYIFLSHSRSTLPAGSRRVETAKLTSDWQANILNFDVPTDSLIAPTGYVLSQYGILLRRNWLDATFHFCRRASYDQALVDCLRAQEDPFVFLDIGANQGLYSILAALNRHCQHVVAFEPVARTFALLSANILVNGVAAAVNPVQAAVSSTSGRTAIIKKPGHSGAASLRRLPRWFHASEEISTIGPEELRALVPATCQLIIKIDVEGHEKIVLEALAHSGVINSASTVFYEANPEWNQRHVLKAILEQQGFRSFVHTSSRFGQDVLATR